MKNLIEPIHALPGGGVLVVGVNIRDYKYNVLRLDNTGSVIETITVIPDNIYELILMESDVLLLHETSVTRVRLRDGEVVNRYKVRDVREYLISGVVLDDNNILLLDEGDYEESDGRVFKYRLSDGHIEDKVNNLHDPQYVTRTRTN